MSLRVLESLTRQRYRVVVVGPERAGSMMLMYDPVTNEQLLIPP
jgi:predicted CoA-binding protein